MCYEAVYGFYLSPLTVGGAELTLGGIDTSKLQGDIIYAPLIDRNSGHWILETSEIFVNGHTSSTLQNDLPPVLFDSGTSNVLFPTNITEVFIFAPRNASIEILLTRPSTP